MIRALAQHRLEEARGFHDLQLAAFQRAVLDIYDNVAMSLDTGQVMYIDFDVFSHDRQASFGAAKVEIGRSGAAVFVFLRPFALVRPLRLRLALKGASSPISIIW